MQIPDEKIANFFLQRMQKIRLKYTFSTIEVHLWRKKNLYLFGWNSIPDAYLERKLDLEVQRKIGYFFYLSYSRICAQILFDVPFWRKLCNCNNWSLRNEDGGSHPWGPLHYKWGRCDCHPLWERWCRQKNCSIWEISTFWLWLQKKDPHPEVWTWTTITMGSGRNFGWRYTKWITLLLLTTCWSLSLTFPFFIKKKL